MCASPSGSQILSCSCTWAAHNSSAPSRISSLRRTPTSSNSSPSMPMSYQWHESNSSAGNRICVIVVKIQLAKSLPASDADDIKSCTGWDRQYRYLVVKQVPDQAIGQL